MTYQMSVSNACLQYDRNYSVEQKKTTKIKSISQVPHDTMPASRFLRFPVVKISHTFDLMLKVFGPVTVLHVVVVLFSVSFREARQYAQRIFHFVLEIFAHEILESFSATLEQSDVIDDSRKKHLMKRWTP